jgi:UDP-glucose 4-epimerase
MPKLRAALLRYFNPIGAHPSGLIGELPHGTPNNLVPYITQTAAGLHDVLTVYGNDYNTEDGTCIRDYIHVVDLAQAHVAALTWLSSQGQACEAFNLGSGQGHSVLEVVKTFEKVSGKELSYTLGPRRPGDVEQIYASPAKANTILKWETKLSLEEALSDAWNWQQKLVNA